TAARLALLSNATTGAAGNLVVLADRSEQSAAVNRFRFADRLPRFLMPGDTLAVVYDAEAAAWVEIGQAQFRDRFDVFADTLSPACLDASTSGAGAHSAAAGETWRIATGTTAGGAARWGSPAGSLRFGGDGVFFLARLAVETLSGWPDRFVLRAGLHDAGLGPSPTSGAWWEYDASLASTWRRCTASAAGVTRDSGGFPVGTGPAWLGIFVDPAAACADFIYSADGRSWQVDGGRHPLAATSSLAFGIDIAKTEGETERGVLVGFAAVRAAGRHAP
ncbi:MAG TPA: hypothetical protein VJS15_05750, partial [Allosphingosinicella sp.]|nr:hypothetical protein [Allosphingosinicella sp.]